MRTAIIGSGSIGTVLGSLLTKGGVQVDLIDSYKEHVEALKTNGASIIGGLDFNIPVNALTPDEITGTYDVIFLLCKQTGTVEALSNILNHLHKDSIVCTLQNGIPEEFVSEIVGKNRTLGGIVLFGATWISPGVVCCTSGNDHMMSGVLIEIGELNGEITQRILKLQAYLSNAGRCDVTTKLLETRWTKVLINATASGMSAAMGCDYGTILDDECAMLSLAHIGDETAKVANAKGIKLTTVDGNNYQDCKVINNESVDDKIMFYYNLWNEKHRALKASMLQDLEKGRQCEIDFINGKVCCSGREVGVPTPYNDMVVALVKLQQKYKFVINKDDALAFFKILLNKKK